MTKTIDKILVKLDFDRKELEQIPLFRNWVVNPRLPYFPTTGDF